MPKPVEPRPEEPTQREARMADQRRSVAQDAMAKLPKWAREKIESLERNLASARAERDVALTRPASNTAYQRHGAMGAGGNGPDLVYLPEDASVVFFLDKATKETPRIERHGIEVSVARNPHRKPHIRISAWGRQVAVYPVAANTFNVVEVDDAP